MIVKAGDFDMKERKNEAKTNPVSMIFATAAMFFLVIALLLASVWVAAYGDSRYRFYEREYQKYTVTDALGMKLEDVMDVTEYMMDYLIGREETLSIETDVDGKYQDFFNEQDRLHMEDVRNLFLGGLALMRILVIASLLIMLLLRLKKQGDAQTFWKAYQIAMGVFALLLIFLGIAFSVDFTRCFAIFHHIFFTNDLWLFDPAEDYMIRMLPEGFFSDMAVRIVVVFVAFLAALGAGLFVWKRFEGKRP